MTDPDYQLEWWFPSDPPERVQRCDFFWDSTAQRTRVQCERIKGHRAPHANQRAFVVVGSENYADHGRWGS